MSDSEKYEVLEKIGELEPWFLGLNSVDALNQGHGSFGIIRKVKRKSDGYVSKLPWLYMVSRIY